jgi:hypothetical protein
VPRWAQSKRTLLSGFCSSHEIKVIREWAHGFGKLFQSRYWMRDRGSNPATLSPQVRSDTEQCARTLSSNLRISKSSCDLCVDEENKEKEERRGRRKRRRRGLYFFFSSFIR